MLLLFTILQLCKFVISQVKNLSYFSCTTYWFLYFDNVFVGRFYIDVYGDKSLYKKVHIMQIYIYMYIFKDSWNSSYWH